MTHTAYLSFCLAVMFTAGLHRLDVAPGSGCTSRNQHLDRRDADAGLSVPRCACGPWFYPMNPGLAGNISDSQLGKNSTSGPNLCVCIVRAPFRRWCAARRCNLGPMVRGVHAAEPEDSVDAAVNIRFLQNYGFCWLWLIRTQADSVDADGPV